MKNSFLLLLSSFLILAGCTQDSVQTEATQLTQEQRFQARVDLLRAQFAKSGTLSQNQSIDSRATCNKVPICHNGHSIVVNQNAVPAHVAHGDQITCCENSCLNNAEVLLTGGPYTFYYDTDVDDCLGFLIDGFDELLILGYDEGSSYVGVESNTVGTTVYYAVYVSDDSGYNCFDFYPTQEEYECARDYMKSFLEVKTCIPNFCDLEF